ncbi:MAG: hypothetical protein QG574_4138 [Cyanobacteriota bacterium erpe_2018_sw_21hr_WHONDRS-SW48-000092_B_bin.40]|nr:hypothetical protein [Cyanobacteriota bacterium erpe_2018_sw_21hr_WHONDRS-SW48-000092_B_bin.40]
MRPCLGRTKLEVATYPGCNAVRDVLRVSQVVPGVPKWLSNILKEQATSELGKSLEGQSRTLDAWFGPLMLDHCGTTDWGDIPACFVSEPYNVDAKTIIKLRKIGRRLGFAVAYDPVSYYYPGVGGCQRIVLFPITTPLNSKSHPAAVLALIEAGGTVADLEF